ncbi:MAG TPA: metallophosphoesterase family protein [Polyangiales bacterium]|nr:metallophosphoesterase family protein [Polyangiales bacterium]
MARARKWVKAEAALPLDDQGGLRLVIVADTHSRPHPAAADHIRTLAPGAILHAGDIGNRQVIDELAQIAPVIAVRGNIDERAVDLPDSVAIDIRDRGESALTLLLMHIAVYGPRIRADAARLAASHGARLIVCGHSHVPFMGRDRGLTVFNPGSIGPRRMHLPIVFGVMEITAGKLSLRHIDCETGEGWSPDRSAAPRDAV